MDPFAFIPVDRRPQVLSAAALVSLACMLTLYYIGPANLAKALEASTSQDEVNKITASFGNHGRGLALLNLAIDYVFIPAYVSGLGLACLAFLNHDVSGIFRSVGIFAAMLAYVAGAADVIENTSLVLTLLWRFDALIMSLARIATVIKLMGLAVGFVFILAATARIALNLQPSR